MSWNRPRPELFIIASLALAGCERGPALPPLEVGDAAAAIEELAAGRGAAVVNLFATW